MNQLNLHLSEGNEFAVRQVKLKKLEAIQGCTYPNDFVRTHEAQTLQLRCGQMSQAALEEKKEIVQISGRIIRKRSFGKLVFLVLQDMHGTIQVALSAEGLSVSTYEQWVALLDLGDIIGIQGHLFKTMKGELTVRARFVKVLVKALRPMPEKFHGLAETELCYRQRYLDLMSNPETRARFRKRSQIISVLREFLSSDGFLEVETPMMQTLAGGAVAKPFVTHHNALGCDLFLRVSPELYLKQLVIGGFEKVFEINRNFRNEGISTQHNPEFTMLEFYEAYGTYESCMEKTERLIRHVVKAVKHQLQFESQGIDYDLSQPFRRLNFIESLHAVFQKHLRWEEWSETEAVTRLVLKLGISLDHLPTLGHRLLALFEHSVESTLIQPTFVVGYPAAVSPLARRCNDTMDYTERFELFINGTELANGFSELNNPAQQQAAFEAQAQAKNAGDEEAMPYDVNYVHALEYGLPPTAGAGIGVDRLVMWLTNCSSIKDVILFPTLRKKQSN